MLRSNPINRRQFHNIVLIQTPCVELEDDRLEPPLGLLYLSTWLNQHGYQTQIVDLSSVPPNRWSDLIPQASVYGFSTYTTTYTRTLEILQTIKDLYPTAVTVAGGPHASALPEIVAQTFDFVVVGEGEMACLHLLQALECGKPPPQKILLEEPIEDLDSLPFPDYSLVDISTYRRVVNGRPSLSILSSRGCPYHCVFCNSIIFNKDHPRFRSALNVAEEIRQIKMRWGTDTFRFQDDLFTANLPRLRSLAAYLEQEQIVYRCFGRTDRCSPEVANLLYQSGCRHIAFGVESGSDFLLKRMQKGQTTAQIRKGIANAKAAGLIVRVYLLIGFPGETWQTIAETVNLMRECNPDEFSVYPLIPYPGTPIYKNPETFGITAINADFSRYFQVQRRRETGYVFRTADLDEQIISDMRAHVIAELESKIIWAGNSLGFK
jgi:radical SAM superfamily enzyme YgiQ (UPF0313 family)